MGSTFNATAVVEMSWSVPLGLSASALTYSTAASGQEQGQHSLAHPGSVIH